MTLHFEMMKSPYGNMSDAGYTAKVTVKKFVDEQAAAGRKISEADKVGLRGAIALSLLTGKNELDIPID